MTMPKKKIEEINEENYQEGVEKQIEEYCEEALATTDTIINFGEKYDGEVDEVLMAILETSFIMLFNEKDLPLELISLQE